MTVGTARVEVPAAGPLRLEAAARPTAPAADGVLLVVPWDQEVGGVASAVGNLALHLRRQGREVVFLHPDEEAEGVRERTTAWGFRGYTMKLRAPSVPGRVLRSRLAFALFLPVTLWRLARLVRRHRVGVVNVHYPVESFLPLALLRRIAGVRLVTSVHGSDLLPGGRPRVAYPLSLRWLLAASDRVVAPSTGYLAAVLERFPGLAPRAEVIHNGVNAEALDRDADSPAPVGRAPYLLCIADLVPWKGHDTLLRAFAEVAAARPALRLALLGDTQLRAEVEALAERLGIRSRVDLLGERGRAEVAALLRGCELFVLASRAESFGLAVAEAQACGRAVVATRVGGLPEVVEDGITGLLVPPDAAEALARAVGALLDDPALRGRMGEAGRTRVRSLFRPEGTGAAYARLFGALLGRPRPGVVRLAPGTPLVGPTARWELSDTLPMGWSRLLREYGGGFFHTPAAVGVSLPAGEPVYARLLRDGATVGVALATAVTCRFGGRHLHLATLPTLRAGEEPDAALRGLLSALAERFHAAEVCVDSFDAGWIPRPVEGAVEGRLRHEYRLPLCADPEALAARFGRAHRRHLARGEREGWTFRSLCGDEAAAVLHAVQSAASDRATRRGDPFVVGTPAEALRRHGAEPHRAWGIRTFAAYAGDELLAAVLAGWGGGRAFYLVGGSTPEGYRRSAAVWLHWRVMALLAAHGCAAYDLGGTSASAAAPSDPAHGLFRFKTGFGAEVVPCRGLRLELAPLHLRAHRAAAGATRILPRR